MKPFNPPDESWTATNRNTPQWGVVGSHKLKFRAHGKGGELMISLYDLLHDIPNSLPTLTIQHNKSVTTVKHARAILSHNREFDHDTIRTIFERGITHGFNYNHNQSSQVY